MLGVCYYPEHWPQEHWSDDAQMMAELGLRYVRIGEFAWSRMEPNPGDYQFDWLDDAIDVLGTAGLSVILCTPTATPPKWLIDLHPEILPVDPHTARTRRFGSRRHYDFSNEVYQKEALRITTALCQRYGDHKHVVGWQTDNELGCHDTTLSASDSALKQFRRWCQHRYGNIDTLNQAWGNVFWSMEYRSFGELDLPVNTVTEANPAHQLAYRRFASDQVVTFQNHQIEVIRAHAPTHFITHNFIPMVDTASDNFQLAADLDFASYDNYPLGRSDLQFSNAATDTFTKYMRSGHPDFATYYHDQTRGLKRRGFWIMEQQPGPVNWAYNNPRPAPGMIRFWSLEAMAHGAECVSYFRWRQAPFAQEQMHAGILRVDNSKTEAWHQISIFRQDIENLSLLDQPITQARVAIVTSADSQRVSDIEQQGIAYEFNRVQFASYHALRRLGLDVDIVSAEADISGYQLVIAPCLPIVSPQFVENCRNSDATIVFGPRSGAKTDEFRLPENLPPGLLTSLLPIRVLSVETLRADCIEPFTWQNNTYHSRVWREELDPGDTNIEAINDDGSPAVVSSGRFHYLAGLTCDAFLIDYYRHLCAQCGINTYQLHPDIRLRQRGKLLFVFNHGEIVENVSFEPEYTRVLGSSALTPKSVAVWRQA